MKTSATLKFLSLSAFLTFPLVISPMANADTTGPIIPDNAYQEQQLKQQLKTQSQQRTYSADATGEKTQQKKQHQKHDKKQQGKGTH